MALTKLSKFNLINPHQYGVEGRWPWLVDSLVDNPDDLTPTPIGVDIHYCWSIFSMYWPQLAFCALIGRE